MRQETLKGIGCILFSVCIWSGWMVASRYAMKGALTSADITAIRFTVAGLVLLPVAWKRGLGVGPWGLKGGLLLSMLIGAPYTFIAVMGMKFAPASHASCCINGTLLVITTAAGILLLKEPTSTLRLMGVICSLCGIILLLAAKPAEGFEEEWKGHMLFVVSGVLWSGYTLLVRAWKADALTAAGAVSVLSMLVYMPLYLLFADSHITLASWQEVAFQAFYQGLLTAVIALISFNAGIRLLGASRAGAFIPLVPVFSTLLAIPVLGEIPGPTEILAVSAVSLGVLLASGVIRLPRRTAG